MALLKKYGFLMLSLIALNTQAQDKTLMNDFSQSYDYEYIKKYEDAIKALKTHYSASSYEINFRLGWLYYVSQNYTESVNYYNKAIALMPAATEPIWAAIKPLTALEKWNTIESHYYTMLKLDPKNASASYQLGYIYYFRKDYVKAKKFFDVSLNLYPFDYNNMLMSGWTNYFLGNKNQARTLFNKALLYSPNDESALQGLSLLK